MCGLCRFKEGCIRSHGLRKRVRILRCGCGSGICGFLFR